MEVWVANARNRWPLRRCASARWFGFSGQFVPVRFDGDPFRYLSLPGELTTS